MAAPQTGKKAPFRVVEKYFPSDMIDLQEPLSYTQAELVSQSAIVERHFVIRLWSIIRASRVGCALQDSRSAEDPKPWHHLKTCTAL